MENEELNIHQCKFCGCDTYLEPEDQEYPSDYCHHDTDKDLKKATEIYCEQNT